MEIKCSVKTEFGLSEIFLDDENKFYVIFNFCSFLIYNNNKLHSLTNDNDVDINISEIISGLKKEGTHFVAEFSSMDDVLDFYNSKLWKECYV